MDRGIVKAVERAAKRQPVVVVEGPAGLAYQEVVGALVARGVYKNVVDLSLYAGVGGRELVALLDTCEHGTVITATQANPGVYVAVDHVQRLSRPGHFLLIGEYVRAAALLHGRIKPLVMAPPTMSELHGGPSSYLTSLLSADPDTSQCYAELDVNAWSRIPFTPDPGCVTDSQAALLATIASTGANVDDVLDGDAERHADLVSLKRAHLVELIDSWRGGNGWVFPAGWSASNSRDSLRCLVASELLAQCATGPEACEVACLAPIRPAGAPIDLILTAPGEPDGVWVQVSDRTDVADLDVSDLSTCRRRWPGAFRRGVIFYAGYRCVALAPGVFAVPITSLWTVTAPSITTDSGSLDAELNSMAAMLRQQMPDLTRNSIERTQRLTGWLEANAARPLGKVVATLGNLGLGCEISVVGTPGSHADAVLSVTAGPVEVLGTIRACVEGELTIWRTAVGERGSEAAEAMQDRAHLAWSDSFAGGYGAVLDRLVADLVAQLPAVIAPLVAARRAA